MFCARLAKYEKPFLSLGKRAASACYVNNHLLKPSTTLFSQVNSTCYFSTGRTKTGENELVTQNRLIESRSKEEEKKAKDFLGLINTCDLRKYYYAEETKRFLDSNGVLLPGELSSCISYMYRIGLTKLVLQVFRTYDSKGLFGLMNVTSLKYTMLCCAKENDPNLLHHIYQSLNSKRKSSIVLNSTYIRCLLSLNDLKTATTLLASYLNDPVYKNTTVLSKNDIYSNVIVGFYEGKYYSRSLKAFHSLRPDSPILNKEQTNDVSEENWKSVQNSICYSAVIGSYYRLNDPESVIQYYEECRALKLFPSYLESMMVAQTYYNSDDYKLLYDELLTKKGVLRGIPEIEKERYLLNLSKITQTRKALRQVYWNWHYYRNQKPKFDKDNDTINIYTGDYGDVGSCLQLLATVYDLKAFTSKDLSKTTIVIKNGSNQLAMKEIVDFLEKEMYPILPYQTKTNRVFISAADAQLWVKTRRTLSLELR